MEVLGKDMGVMEKCSGGALHMKLCGWGSEVGVAAHGIRIPGVPGSPIFLAPQKFLRIPQDSQESRIPRKILIWIYAQGSHTARQLDRYCTPKAHPCNHPVTLQYPNYYKRTCLDRSCTLAAGAQDATSRKTSPQKSERHNK